MNVNYPKRKPLRLNEYDYNTPGAYFVTFCTHNRRNTLSKIVGAIHESPGIRLTDYGVIVERILLQLPDHLGMTIDRYVIMPNHIHLLLRIEEEDVQRAIHESPLKGRSQLSKTVGYIKMNVSREINRRFGQTQIWQRGYYDHVVRNEQDYCQIANYIEENPLRWKLDALYAED